jgi:hypothetical protein
MLRSELEKCACQCLIEDQEHKETELQLWNPLFEIEDLYWTTTDTLKIK